MVTLNRRLLTLLAVAALGLSACGKTGGSAVTTDDMSLGNPNAKVTVVEYASVACPFCAQFNNTSFPAFKAQYIDSGKIHYVFREMLVGSPMEASFAAAGFLMSRCAGKDKYFAVNDAIFHGQEAMYQSGQIREGLLKISQSAGMSEKQFTDCVNNADSLKALQDRVDNYTKNDGVDSTPTFVINGKKLDGTPTLASLSAAINAAQAGAK